MCNGKICMTEFVYKMIIGVALNLMQDSFDLHALTYIKGKYIKINSSSKYKCTDLKKMLSICCYLRLHFLLISCFEFK